MICRDLKDLIEPVAAGDLELDAGARAHLESCPRCAAELTIARRLEAALAAREAPPAPERFTPFVLQRIRRDRWRAEQHVDRLFNAAMVVALLLVAGGIVALMNLSGVLAAASGTWAIIAGAKGHIAREAAPTVNTYVAAACLLVSAMGMWWWAERKMSL